MKKVISIPFLICLYVYPFLSLISLSNWHHWSFDTVCICMRACVLYVCLNIAMSMCVSLFGLFFRMIKKINQELRFIFLSLLTVILLWFRHTVLCSLGSDLGLCSSRISLLSVQFCHVIWQWHKGSLWRF